MSGSGSALAGSSGAATVPQPATRTSLLSYLELPDFSTALVRPVHLRSNYFAFLLMYGGFSFAAFARAGIAAVEQVYLVNEFGRTVQETLLPSTIVGFTGLLLAFVWAYVTDRINFLGFGYRLPYVIIGQSVAFATILATALVPGGPATAVGWGVYVSMSVIRSFALSLSSFAFSGWIIDANVRDRIGMLSLVGAVGRTFGLAAVVPTAGYFINAFGFLPNFVLFCGALSAPYLVISLTLTKAIVEEKDLKAAAAEAAEKAATAEPSSGVFIDVVRAVKREMAVLSFFTSPAVISIVVLTVTGTVGNVIGNLLVNLFLMNQMGLTIVDISHLGTISLLANFPGSIFAAYALDNWDCRWAIFWTNALTALTVIALLWTPRDAAFWYNVLLNVVGSCTGQAANALIGGITLRAAPPKYGASYLAVFAAIMSIVDILTNQLAGHISTLDDSYRLSFITGACVTLFGCLAVPFLGESAKVPKPVAAVTPAAKSASALVDAPDDATVATNPLLAHTLKGDTTGASNTTSLSVDSVEEWRPPKRG